MSVVYVNGIAKLSKNPLLIILEFECEFSIEIFEFVSRFANITISDLNYS